MASIEIPYWPRKPFVSFHERDHRWAILVCHRRAGKTVATINDMLARAIQCRRQAPRFAFIFPQRNQAKDAAWKYLRHYSQPAWSQEPYENELRVELVNGASIRLYGADNPDALRGAYLDGVVLDEFPQMKPDVWSEVVRPMLADRNGWATFIGTPKGKNEFWRLYDDAVRKPELGWYNMMLKASESGLIPVKELEDLKREYAGLPDKYAQEFECEFEAAIQGAFYANEMRTMLAEQRIRPLEINKDVRVHTAWDLGVSDSTAIWFIQAVGRERRCVDYYEGSGVGLDHYTEVLYDKRAEHKWTYGEHYFPHDVKVREFTSGKSRVDSLAGLGIEAATVGQHNVLDGINVTRRMLGRTWIDSNRCERGIEALRQYRREYDDRLKDWKTGPLHDWTSHGADALRCFAVGFDDASATPIIKRPKSEPPSGATHWSA